MQEEEELRERERSLRTLEKRKSKERNEGVVSGVRPLIVPSPYLMEKQAEEEEMLFFAVVLLLL